MEKNELVVKDEKNFVVPSGQLEIDTEDLDGLTISLDKISIPSGGGQMWELPGLENPEEPEYSKDIEGVIVDHYPVMLTSKMNTMDRHNHRLVAQWMEN